MRVVVTGATGNVGTSFVQALSASAEIGEIVGVARRLPAWRPTRTRWCRGDVLTSDLAGLFKGSDAVIHLAWAIQPSHDQRTLEQINLEGTRRVLSALRQAEVPKLVYASSVGAYAKGPKDREVDESWPIGGTPSSFYSRHKAAVERLLDDFESRSDSMKIVRLRPGLIFKREAASEIRRLFAGPFLPSFLVGPKAVPVVPRIDRLRFQAVHSTDVAQAYLQATLRDVEGSFNVAADPPLGAPELAQIFRARPVSVPPRLVRRVMDLTWRLRLQPSPSGWFDMALDVPLMSSQRARRELEWRPRVDGIAALEELLAGIRAGQGFPTPPLERAGARGRVHEIRTEVGGRQ